MEAAIQPWKLYRWIWDDANWHFVKDFNPACLNNVCPLLIKQTI